MRSATEYSAAKNYEDEVTEREAECQRRCLPWGMWWCENGRVVLFNYAYQRLILQQRKDMRAPALRAKDWGEFQKPKDWERVGYFYTERDAPWLNFITRIHLENIIFACLRRGNMPTEKDVVLALDR